MEGLVILDDKALVISIPRITADFYQFSAHNNIHTLMPAWRVENLYRLPVCPPLIGNLMKAS